MAPHLFTAAFFLMCATFSHAQMTKQKSHIQLVSGEKMQGELVVYSPQILEYPVFLVDGEEFETSNIAYIQNRNGYFANLDHLYQNSPERYALRIRKGRMNLFEEIDMDIYGGETLYTTGDVEIDSELLASGLTFQYYSIANDRVRKANYGNLKMDLAACAGSMDFLRDYRKYQWLQVGLIAGGAGLITQNVISMTGGPVQFNPIMALGLIVGGSSYFLEKAKSDALWLAADEYNKYEEPAVVQVP
jgi:hypothetical protein